MQTNLENVVKKIRKLLALATSSNEHEARAAAERASELMVKYNLEMQAVGGERDYVEQTVDEMSRMSPEIKFVNSIVVLFFFVAVIKTRVRTAVGGSTSTVMVGEKANVEIAAYVHAFLRRAMREGFREYQAATGAKARDRQSYYYGFYKGLCDQLAAKKAAVEQQVGLVVVEDAGLAKYLSETRPALRTQRQQSVPVRSDEARDHGYAQGQNTRISRGLSSQGEAGLALAAAPKK